MSNSGTSKKKAFFKEHVLPVFFIFLIPGFSAWFFDYAENQTDREIQQDVASEVKADTKLPEADKAKILEFYQRVPVSRIMASRKPEAAKVQAMFEPAKTRYAIFRWMKRIAWPCLGTIGITFVLVGLSVAFSLRSQAAQYYALRIGWPVLRTSAAIQVLGQAVLAVALSFWVTAILTNSYIPKLILIIGFLAVAGVITLWYAIFGKVNDRYDVAGELIPEDEAPNLWRRIREIAGRLDTAAPDRIVVGIAPSFFVTEHPVTVAGEVHQGRTLYLSLPMLKVLAIDEADAVLGHELAHFSGQDTLWSRKVSPLIGKFTLYLRMLASGLTIVVAHFMHFFWKLYHLSIRRLSRAREFRADQVGAEVASKEAMKRALVKITCYCEFRAGTEQAILSEQGVDPELNLSLQLEHGYAAFISGFVNSAKAIDERVPHPFDTHPTLSNRLEQLGFQAHDALRDSEIQKAVANSWYGAINTAPVIEERMWAERQKTLQSFQTQDLVWRLVPQDEDDIEIVRAYFPNATFRKEDGSEAILAFDRIKLAEWDAPILFKDIVSAQLEEAWPKKRLTLTHEREGQPKAAKTKFYPGLFIGERGDLLAMFSRYYSRHKTAETARQTQAEVAA